MKATYQNLWDVVKAEHRRIFIALTTYIGSEERPKNNHLSFHFKKVEKKEQINSKVSINNIN